MRNLRLVGLSGDGQRVVFVDDTGAEFSAPADDRLRAALRGDRARLGQLEIEMDSALRPRDIQARIRAGESPEAVAALAQVSVDKIMAFCVPVLAERRHMTELAQRSHVRRKGAEGPARQLTDVVTERLGGRGIDPESAEWDSWRREDGRWAVQATYRSGERQRSALFTFDATGRYSVADDDEARWLTGERSNSKGPQPREAKPGERRLSSVPDEDEDLLSLSEPDDLTAVVHAVREPGAEEEVQETAEAAVPAEPGKPAVEEEQEPRVHQEAAAEKPSTAEQETEPTPTRKRRGGRRASVPSWDEIMFGKGGNDT